MLQIGDRTSQIPSQLLHKTGSTQVKTPTRAVQSKRLVWPTCEAPKKPDATSHYRTLQGDLVENMSGCFPLRRPRGAYRETADHATVSNLGTSMYRTWHPLFHDKIARSSNARDRDSDPSLGMTVLCLAFGPGFLTSKTICLNARG